MITIRLPVVDESRPDWDAILRHMTALAGGNDDENLSNNLLQVQCLPSLAFSSAV